MKKAVTLIFLLAICFSLVVCPCSFAASGNVFFEGKPLESGILEEDGIKYILFSEAAAAENFQVRHEEKSAEYSFPWRLSEVVINSAEHTLTYEGETKALPCKQEAENEELLVSVYDFCDDTEIGTYYDDETGILYCTAGSGNWELPGGYDIAVMMYHATGTSGEGDNLVMPPYMLEEQLKYITENGYTTVCFEDLWNIENISKPVMLIFDDGWSNNYRHLLPLLEQYDCKATVAIVEDFIDNGSHIHLNSDEVKEMAESGHVSIQSHTVSHDELGLLSRERQEYEMSESKRFITRLVGKEPFALIYPTGSHNEDTLDLLPTYYRFGVKMCGKPYNTSDDPRLIYRFFPQNFTSLTVYSLWLESVFGPLDK